MNFLVQTDSNNRPIGQFKVYILRITPPALYPLSGGRSATFLPMNGTICINLLAIGKGGYGHITQPSWVQRPTEAPTAGDTGTRICVVYVQDPSA